MPRRTQYRRCEQCGKQAQLGAFTNFYIFGSRSQPEGASSRSRSNQVKGTLPTHGFCIACFLQLHSGDRSKCWQTTSHDY